MNERITELESITDASHVTEPACQLLTKLQTHDSEFRKAHFDLIDLIDEADTTSLDNEQAIIDKFDDDISNYAARLETLIKRAPVAPAAAATVAPPDRRSPTRKMSRIRAGLEQVDKRIVTATGSATSCIDQSLLAQCQEEAFDYKKDLAIIIPCMMNWISPMMMTCSTFTRPLKGNCLLYLRRSSPC